MKNTPEGAVDGYCSENESLATTDAKLSTMEIIGITVSSSQTFNISNNFRGMIITLNSSEATCSIYFLVANASGAVSVFDVHPKTSSALSFNTSTANKLTINVSSGSIRAEVIKFGGTVSLAS